MSETKEQEDSANTRPPAEQCEATPEYRSHVGRGKVALDQLKEGDKVRFQKSATESPLWVVDSIKYNKQTRRNEYQLKKPDGSLHGQTVAREKLTLQT